MVEGGIKWKQNCETSLPAESRCRAVQKQQKMLRKKSLREWKRFYFLDAIMDQGMIEIGHAWAILIPFPLMKPLLP